jgi:hypothetical protein
MVERMLSMHEAQGSIPRWSIPMSFQTWLSGCKVKVKVAGAREGKRGKLAEVSKSHFGSEG